MAWPESPDLSYLDLMHKVNDRMIERAVELQSRLKQIISETDDAQKREWAIQQLKIFERMANSIPKTF
jgi:hypothetical protein